MKKKYPGEKRIVFHLMIAIAIPFLPQTNVF
jgi:hypothetical protein